MSFTAEQLEIFLDRLHRYNNIGIQLPKSFFTLLEGSFESNEKLASELVYLLIIRYGTKYVDFYTKLCPLLEKRAFSKTGTTEVRRALLQIWRYCRPTQEKLLKMLELDVLEEVLVFIEEWIQNEQKSEKVLERVLKFRKKSMDRDIEKIYLAAIKNNPSLVENLEDLDKEFRAQIIKQEPGLFHLWQEEPCVAVMEEQILFPVSQEEELEVKEKRRVLCVSLSSVLSLESVEEENLQKSYLPETDFALSPNHKGGKVVQTPESVRDKEIEEPFLVVDSKRKRAERNKRMTMKMKKRRRQQRDKMEKQREEEIKSLRRERVIPQEVVEVATVKRTKKPNIFVARIEEPSLQVNLN